MIEGGTALWSSVRVIVVVVEPEGGAKSRDHCPDQASVKDSIKRLGQFRWYSCVVGK